MGEMIFCVNCGQKMMSNSKYCPKCGTKVVQINGEMDMENNIPAGAPPVDIRLSENFRENIRKNVLESYLGETKIIRSGLYGRGERYNYTTQQIDEIIAEYDHNISEYNKYLDSLYMCGSFLMCDVTDEIKTECGAYAERYGFTYEEGGNLYEKYVKDHLIRQKNAMLLTLLIGYRENGFFDDSRVKDDDLENAEFKKNEYPRLKNAVKRLKDLQATMYEKSNSLEISEENKNVLYEEGMKLGFYAKEDIKICVIGNEIPLGIKQKKVNIERDKLRKKGENYFKNAFTIERFRLFNKEIIFGSCYFIENFTREFFKTRLDNRSCQIIQKINLCKKEKIENENYASELITLLIYGSTEWLQDVVNYAKKLQLSDEFHENMISFLEEDFLAFQEDLKDLQSLFAEIEQGVEAKKMEGELRKAFRGKWLVSGIGLEGMINSAITGTVLNAGTGLAYDAINGVSAAISKHDAKLAKEKLTDAAIEVLIEFLDMMKENLADFILAYIARNIPYSVWIKEIFQRDTYEKYSLEKENNGDKENRILLALELLKDNPYKATYYRIIFEEIQELEESEKKTNTNSLLKIAALFKIDKLVRRSLFDSLIGKCNSADMQCCDRLFEMEQILQTKDDKAEKKIYDAYLSREFLENETDYSAEKIALYTNKFKEFQKKYNYQAKTVEQQLKEKIFQQYNVELHTDNIENIQNNINSLILIGANSSWNLSDLIEGQKRRLVERRKEEHIKACTVEILTGYDIKSKEFITDTMVAKTPEHKEKVIENTGKIKAECKKLSLEMEKEEFEKIQRRLIGLCEESKYESSILSNITEQWMEEDKQKRTVKNVEYQTRKEAAAVRLEIDFIDKIYKDGKLNIFQKYKTVAEHSFNSAQANEQVREKEKELLGAYAHEKNNSKPLKILSDAKNDSIDLLKSLGGALLWTVVGIVAFLHFHNIIVRIIVILFVIGIWGESEAKDILRDIIRRPADGRKSAKWIEKFDAMFIIENGHILLKK